MHLLFDEMGTDAGIGLSDVAPDMIAEIPDHEHHLIDAELQQVVQDVAHDRFPGHVDEGLRRKVGVGPKPCTLPREWDDGFHMVTALPFR